MIRSSVCRINLTRLVCQAARPIRQARTPDEDADFWRNKGNEFFKFGNHAKAKQCYTSSIAALPSAAAFTNRALVCTKLKEWTQAETDCLQVCTEFPSARKLSLRPTAVVGLHPQPQRNAGNPSEFDTIPVQAIEQDSEYLKAWQRRATVRKQQGNTMGCLDDLQQALQLAPRSAAISSELRSVLRAKMADTGLQLPAELIEASVALEKGPRSDVGGAQPCTDTCEAPSPPATAQAASSSAARPGLDGSQDSQRNPALDTSTQPSLANSTLVRPALPSEAGSEAPASAASRPRSATGSRSASGRGSPLEDLDLPTRPLKAPSTCSEFESTWRGLKGDLDAQSRYLRLIQPETLPRILKSSLTPYLLEGVVRTVLQGMLCRAEGGASAEDAGLGVRMLQGLAKAHRFPMNAMLVPSSRRKALSAAWDVAAGTLLEEHQDAFDALRSVYKL